MALTAASCVIAADPVRTLPSPPGQILDLRANAAGDIYVRTATKVLWMDLQHPEEGWIALALDGVVALTDNTGREVFALQDRKTRLAIHRLAGATANPVTTTPNVPYEHWYVDALGRAWIQNRERLLVAGKNETLIEWPMGQPGYGIRFRQPCEWKPGHVVLFFASIAVWATPEKVIAEAAPLFADDGTGNGPFRLGADRLVSGGCNNKGAGSFLLDPRTPGKEPERLNLGRGDWFYGVATAPDGRLLSRPHRGFVWYAADGRSEVQLKESGPILNGASLAEPGKSRVVFAATGVGFAALPGGMLAVFRTNEAVMITPASGLPLPRVDCVAAVGDDLIMAGGGKIVVWRTTEPLPAAAGLDERRKGTTAPLPAAPGLDERREWMLTGPCVRDISGTLWAFLLDAPGKICHHDGKQWGQFPLELQNLSPQDMTGDDKGMLQIGSAHAPSGSALFRDGAVTNWPNQPVRAWVESIRQGATRFRDGSPFRSHDIAAGKAEWLWRYNGRSLWDGEREYDYYDKPPYRYFWLGPDGVCYRCSAEKVWAFADGRWTETQVPPLSIGPDGIRADITGKDRLSVIYDGQLKLPLPRSQASSNPRFLTLQGNEAFIPGPSGGWVGSWRIFRDAHYSVAGRVYPGTNGHYLVDGNTLRYQPRQTLTIDGTVLADGKLRRLVCKIAGVEPPYKPRLLTFLDGEFLDSIAAPDGVDLPPIKPGDHMLEVYAADGFGVVSEQPLRLTLDGGPEFEVVNLELGEDWDLKPRRLQVLPATIAGRTALERSLEIDSDGVVWILVEGGVVALAPAERKATFYRCPAQELLAARGRVWARGERSSDGVHIALLELRHDGIRRAVDLYDDSSYAHQQISADGEGGIWALSHRSAVRWDGKQTRQWERTLDYDPFVATSAKGTIIYTRGHYLIYRDGELSKSIPWPGDFKYRWQQADRIAYPLGRDYLLLPLQRLLLEVESGRPSDRKIPFGDTYRAGPDSSLYVWKGKEFYRISGDDLAMTQLVYSPPPTMPPLWDDGGYEFLATSGGVVAYTVRSERLYAGRADEGAAEYGWQHGVQPGRTHAIREAPDGRIWIMRQAQLLVYDPTQPADAIPSAWQGWRAAPVQERFAVGAFGRVWYGNPERTGFASSDGTNDMTWAQRYPGANAIIVSDNGAAAIGAGTDTYLLSTGKPPERVKDLRSAVLELVKRGAKSFEGDGAPAVAADGRVYFGGKIWDGHAWQSVPDGRASLDPRGEIFLLCMERSSLPVAYRIDGVKAIPLGQVEKCLIDAYGLRWYDPGILEANPGCLPVWYASKETPEVSSDVNATRIRIDPHGSLQALPLGDGQFLMRVGAKLHRLDAQGLTRIPGSAVPCGDELDPGWGLRVWPLADGRWALAVHSRLYISPTDLRLTP
jgi:hypothetical protein